MEGDPAVAGCALDVLLDVDFFDAEFGVMLADVASPACEVRLDVIEFVLVQWVGEHEGVEVWVFSGELDV